MRTPYTQGSSLRIATLGYAQERLQRKDVSQKTYSCIIA